MTENNETTATTSRNDNGNESSGQNAASQKQKKKHKNTKPRKPGVGDEESKVPDKKKLRSPICVVMGHVDAGKTLILDKIRHSNVQHSEIGGITQQIGATFITSDHIEQECTRMKQDIGKRKLKFQVPGLLFIDTPGHESFTNLRERGSNMCDIAIVVIDITHGIEKQTGESIKMLQKHGVPFIVAVNKIDRCLDWTAVCGVADDEKEKEKENESNKQLQQNVSIQTTLAKQKPHTIRDFERRLREVKLDFATHGFNAELYYKNKNLNKDISLVPTSAITGEGIPDLMYLLTKLSERYMSNKLSKKKFKCNVLEVKTVQGYGATIDVILSGGTLEAEDIIIVCGMNKPIITKIKALLLPHPGEEMRVKNGSYTRVDKVVASAGIRIATHESLDTAVAGSQLFILDRKYRDPKKYKRERKTQIDRLCIKVQSTFNDLKNIINKTGRGVYVQASTLGALEALVIFLQSENVPICGINIGNIHKSDVMKVSIQKQNKQNDKKYCVILAFNVKIVPDAQEIAKQVGVKIFQEEIIYQLHERFIEYMNDIRERRKNEAKDVAVFPVEMKILSPKHVFNNKNPIVLGVEITRGVLKIDTPIVVKLYKSVDDNRVVGVPLFLGRVTSMQQDHKDILEAKQGDKIAVRIEGDDSVKNIQVRRSFGLHEKLISRISRNSIDALKVHFKDDLTNDDIRHLIHLKKYFEIV